jgi:hypothetical protein
MGIYRVNAVSLKSYGKDSYIKTNKLNFTIHTKQLLSKV